MFLLVVFSDNVGSVLATPLLLEAEYVIHFIYLSSISQSSVYLSSICLHICIRIYMSVYVNYMYLFYTLGHIISWVVVYSTVVQVLPLFNSRSFSSAPTKFGIH